MKEFKIIFKGKFYLQDNEGNLYNFPISVGGGGGTGLSRSAINKLAWLLDGNNNGIEKFIGTNDAFDFPIHVNGIEIGRFTSLGITLFNGALIQSPSGKVFTFYDDSTPTYDVNVDSGGGQVNDDFMGLGINIKDSVVPPAIARLAIGLSTEAALPLIQGLFSIYFIITESRFQTKGIPSFANDAAAGAAGLTTGDLWQQPDGAGGFTMKVKS